MTQEVHRWKQEDMFEFYADSKYLVFPVSYHAQNKRLYFYFSLDYDKPDFYVPLRCLDLK